MKSPLAFANLESSERTRGLTLKPEDSRKNRVAYFFIKYIDF